jgi:hypothetical protein
MSSDHTYLPDPDDEHHPGRPTTTSREGISPLNPSTFPRAEDDEETFARSPEYHDRPDPGSYVDVHERSW